MPIQGGVGLTTPLPPLPSTPLLHRRHEDSVTDLEGETEAEVALLNGRSGGGRGESETSTIHPQSDDRWVMISVIAIKGLL